MPDLILRSSEWLRGTGGGHSALCLGDRSCCLGIHGAAMGVGRPEMQGVTTPHNLRGDKCNAQFRELWVGEEDGIERSLARADLATIFNDTPIGEDPKTREWDIAEALRLSIPLTPILSDEDRVARLRPIFAEVGWNLVWRPEE